MIVDKYVEYCKESVNNLLKKRKVHNNNFYSHTFLILSKRDQQIYPYGQPFILTGFERVIILSTAPIKKETELILYQSLFCVSDYIFHTQRKELLSHEDHLHKIKSGKGVSIVSKAVPSKTTMPILECILIDASTEVIKLTANDMELGIETSIDGEIIERGILALNARIFSEIVRKLRTVKL